MKVLVTGATGFIGSYVCNEFNNFTDIELIGSVKDDKKTGSIKATSVKIDFQTSGFENAITEIGPDVIIHTVALSQVDYCEQNRSEAWRINVEATEKIAQTAEKNGARMVFLSSDFVFSGQNQFENEESFTNPISFYGETKAVAEQKIIKSCTDYLIIRPVLVYGIPLLPGRDNIVTMIIRNLKESKPLRIVSDQYRTPVFVADLAKFIVKTALSAEIGIYHAGGPEYVSVFDFAVRIADIFGLETSLVTPITSLELNQIGKRPPITRFSNDKAKKIFGYNPRKIDSALRSII